MLTGTPTDLARLDIAQIRAAVESGSNLLTPPIAWGSLWWALPVSALAWCGGTWYGRRIAGTGPQRPPAVQAGYGEEPLRDAHGALAGWPAAAGSRVHS